MGVSSSKIEDDKALVLCRERKHFVRQALEDRCLLAAAHVAYVQSLRSTGTALRKFVEPDAPVESSLCTSTNVTPETHALTDKSISHFSHSSPSMSQDTNLAEPISPAATSAHSNQFHVNHMKTSGNPAATVEERPPVSAMAKLVSSSGTPQSHTSYHSENRSSLDSLLPPPNPWDFFGSTDQDDFSSQDGRPLQYGLENADNIHRVREEEGIPDLEEEGERVAFIGRVEYEASENNNEHLDGLSLRSSKKQSDRYESDTLNESSKLQSIRSTIKKTNHFNAMDEMPSNKAVSGRNEMPGVSALVTLPTEEPTSQNNPKNENLVSIVKEIEFLFIKASESGNELPRMLEANKVHYRPIFSETEGQRSSISTLFAACFGCFEVQEHVPPEPAKGSVQYLTWHRSSSSRSSSSRNPHSSAPNDYIEDGDGSFCLYNTYCMNSGSHASTLNRLYAWERKLYDEVKASGIIRREYDMKCKVLRHQESKGENPSKIDKTRAIVKDLHSRIRVAIHRIDKISKNIEELRDNELQPQLEELIAGFKRMWEMMRESHKRQLDIILVAEKGNTQISMQSEFHQHATILLDNELNSLCSSFSRWISVHKSYLQALNAWLSKCIFPLQRKSSRGRPVPISPLECGAPPVFVICEHWLKELEKLNSGGIDVTRSIKNLVGTTSLHLPQQEKTQRKNAHDRGSTMHVDGNGASLDWSLCFQDLKSNLVSFFESLHNFAELSVKMYAILRQDVELARNRYSVQKRQA